MTDPLDLALSPLSARIQDEAHRVEATRQRHQGFAQVRLVPFEPAIEPVQVNLEQIDPDPGHMSRLKVTEAPRAVERPDAMEDQLRICAPQFTLRNTHRMTAYADPRYLDLIDRRFLDRGWQEDLEMAHQLKPPRVEPETLSSVELAVQVASRRALVVETPWHTRFGRPDPTEEPS